MPGRVVIVVGGQYGSEAKGAVTAFLAKRYGAAAVVRTGGINAGHTVYYKGKPYAMQQLPVGWVVPGCRLILGAGAYIHPDTLQQELNMIDAARSSEGHFGRLIREDLYIDDNASIHRAEDGERAFEAGRHTLIGATGKGCAEAIVGRITDRGKSERRFLKTEAGHQFTPTNTVALLMDLYKMGETIILEGTQGSMLDMYHGPWPYTTSRMTSAAAWMAEAGLSPALRTEIWCVFRTFPIRVAGNSGPLPYEISWVDLAREINNALRTEDRSPIVQEWALREFEHAMGPTITDYCAGRGYLARSLSTAHAEAIAGLPPDTQAELKKLFEFTTVTKKLRRVARFSQAVADEVLRREQPHKVALTFLNYCRPELWNLNPGDLVSFHPTWFNLDPDLVSLGADQDRYMEFV